MKALLLLPLLLMGCMAPRERSTQDVIDSLHNANRIGGVCVSDECRALERSGKLSDFSK